MSDYNGENRDDWDYGVKRGRYFPCNSYVDDPYMDHWSRNGHRRDIIRHGGSDDPVIEEVMREPGDYDRYDDNYHRSDGGRPHRPRCHDGKVPWFAPGFLVRIIMRGCALSDYQAAFIEDARLTRLTRLLLLHPPVLTDADLLTSRQKVLLGELFELHLPMADTKIVTTPADIVLIQTPARGNEVIIALASPAYLKPSRLLSQLVPQKHSVIGMTLAHGRVERGSEL